ncbi:hypothetical protein CERZMDRAFT_99235 [Cercospora zeae-maydis SCOH1-5]|uniref:Uncharacterized protein n=1 Tax=Cercospora zeae-maydis SCOH1-5 TaxID=717836 RepID=A0A6A6FBC7_9PEZI|nr:hypothetical protein CERZMDRAFT_99235 [Cercospora zeae-maydis SCOH1-5]
MSGFDSDRLHCCHAQSPPPDGGGVTDAMKCESSAGDNGEEGDVDQSNKPQQQQLRTPDSEADTMRTRAKPCSQTSIATAIPIVRCRRYASFETCRGVIHAYRVAQYGTMIANDFPPGRTPDEAREDYERRMDEPWPSSSESEQDGDSTDDEETGVILDKVSYVDAKTAVAEMAEESELQSETGQQAVRNRALIEVRKKETWVQDWNGG